jgi:hypothetical protein
MEFQELNGDQRREIINTQQRYAAYREAKDRAKGYRGSMVWTKIKGRDYLVRSQYDSSGVRRQTSLGARSKELESMKLEYERGRSEAQMRLKNLKAVITRQSAINRAIRLGRVPLIAAKIIRALDYTGMLGSHIRVLGTNAIYAYEATAGVHLDTGSSTTEGLDLFFDARSELTLVAIEDVSHARLLHLLRKIDRSFERSNQAFRAVNDDGYTVDLIKPPRNPPLRDENQRVAVNTGDLLASEVEGSAWRGSAPSFEAVTIDEKGEPLRIVATDPRVWVAHKLWLSKRQDREPLKRRRDEAQAYAVGRLVTEYMPHLPYASQQANAARD